MIPGVLRDLAVSDPQMCKLVIYALWQGAGIMPYAPASSKSSPFPE